MSRRPALAARFKRTVAAVAVASCFAAHPALANPTGPTVVNGTAAIYRQGNLLQITNSPNAIINWQSFSIGASEITRFIQQSQSSAVLNRVTGAGAAIDPSVILGALQSNGRVFLINPSGILFGAGAQVDVAGLVASSLNLSNADFLANRLRFTEVPGAGSIINQGNITTGAGGNVYLVGPAVTNSGLISSPKGEVILAAGNSVELVNPGTPNLRVEISAPDNEARNLGTIVADAGRIGIYAGLVNHSGTLRADSAQVTEDGRIVLKATKNATLEAGSITTASGPAGGSITVQSGDTTLVAGTIEAMGTEGKGGTVQVLGNLVGLIDNARVNASGKTSGGTVLIGGDFQGKNPDVQNAFRTYLGADAMITADAVVSGDGGKVIVWSDDATRAYGTISAKGGAQSGNGGFVEVSGKQNLEFDARVDVSAPRGTAGTLLLDPQDITISDTVGTDSNQLSTDIPTGGNPAGSVFFADGGAVTFTITDEALEAQTGNIVLQATRDITVNAGLSGGLNLVNQGTGERVVFQAGRHITIGSPLTTNGAAIILEADSPHSTSGAADRIGQVNIQAPVTSNGGSIILIAGGNRGTDNSIRGPDGNLNTIADNGGFRPAAIVDAGAGGINVALSRNTDELGIGRTGDLTQILGNHNNTADGATIGSIANLRTTGALVIGSATTGGTDGLGVGAQPLTVNKISNVFDNSYITLNTTTPASSFRLVAGSGGITLSEPLTTYQNTFITTTTGTLTINETLATSNNNLTIIANNLVGSQFISVGSGVCSFNGGGCPGIGTQVFWDGGGLSLNWFDAANWSTDTLPSNLQDVTIGAGAGTIVINGAAQAKSLIANSPLQLSSGSLTLTNASNFSSAFTLSGGSLQGPGSVTVGGSNGALTWSGGTMAGGGTFQLASGRNGVLNGSLTLDRLFRNSGTLTLNNATINTGGTGSIVNAGLITVAGGPSSVVNAAISNKVVDPILGTTILGTIQVSGSLTATNFPTNDGIINIANGGTLSTGGNGLSNAATGIISGAGTLNVGSATLTNQGTMSPGASPGALAIVGNLNLASSSVIDVELGGTTQGVSYDLLSVSGTATLGGTLNVTEVGGFLVNPGDQFRVMTCGVACSGTFATTNLPSAPQISAAYLPASVEIALGAVTPPAAPVTTAPGPVMPPAASVTQTVVAATNESVTSVVTASTSDQQQEEQKKEQQKKPMCTGSSSGGGGAAAPVMAGGGGRCTTRGCF